MPSTDLRWVWDRLTQATDAAIKLAAPPGTSAHNRQWIECKKRTVREWAVGSCAIGLRFPLLDAPNILEGAPWMDVIQYSGSGGGFPIVIAGAGPVAAPIARSAHSPRV